MECPICEREVPDERATRHHLKTRKVDPRLIEVICEDCHRYIHKLFTNKELADAESPLNTVEGLLEHPEYARAVAFVRTQDPARKLRIRTSRSRGRRR
jgi:hypothetical protein